MKQKAYILVCVNEERQVVSVDMFGTREAAQNAMFKEYDDEIENAHFEGYGVSDIYVTSNPLDASIEYGAFSYNWTIQTALFNPEDYK